MTGFKDTRGTIDQTANKRQFVGQSPWAVEQVQRGLARKMVDLLSEAQVWILDETALPKGGAHSVGVFRAS